MSKHTPGPWKFTEGEFFYVNARVDGRRVFILQRKKAVVAAATEYQEAEEDRIRADCHLIAAAPELLRELRELAEAAHNVMTVPDSVWAAIAKATGKQP